MINFHSYHADGSDDVIVVELSGHLDTDAAEQFFNRLDVEISKGHRKLVFDCQKLEYISSLGFGMMIRGHSRVQKEGGAVRFARLHGLILEAFQIVGFHKLFQNYSTIKEAAESFD
ncbi:MAG: STAS domain-containing protein [Fuerstiella sp.]